MCSLLANNFREDLSLSNVNVDPTSQVRVVAILLLLIVGKQEIQKGGSFYWH
jgi:hypothetical protein